MQVVVPSSVIVSARSDDRSWARFRSGRATRVHLHRFPIARSTEVIRIARQVDQETREFLVDISLNSLPTNWGAGTIPKCKLIFARAPNSALFPLRFVCREDGKPVVWVLVGGHAHWRQVVLRHSIGPLWSKSNTDYAENDIVLDPTGRYSYQPISSFNEP